MKITTRLNKVQKEVTFPAHFKSLYNNLIALAFSANAGIVVDEGSGTFKKGTFCTNFVSFNDKYSWEKVSYKTTFED